MLFAKKIKVRSDIKELNDLGFSSSDNGARRQVNPDGSFNVERRGLPWRADGFYHTLLTISWFKFNGLVIGAYTVANIFFATIYYAIGLDNMAGSTAQTCAQKFADALFFSAQTLTTVGYGRISPVGVASSSVAAFESLTGLLGFALATGLLYGRFSRPQAHLLFSEQALIAPYKDKSGFMFRIANGRSNQLINVEVQVALSFSEIVNGVTSRRFYQLALEREKIDFFPLSWTIVHPIDEQSPLYGFDKNALEESDCEMMILIKAFDDVFSQSVHARRSYKFHEIVWGAKFTKIFTPSANGKTIIQLDKISEYEIVDLPIRLGIGDTNIEAAV